MPRTPPRSSPKTTRIPSRRAWVSDRQISLLALMAALWGGIHTMFLLSRMPSAKRLTAIGWNPEPLLSHSPYSNNNKIGATNATLIVASARTKDIHQTHVIPKILIFTHYRDLLTEQQFLIDEEEIALAANVRRVIHLHPKDTRVRFLTDDQCIASLQKTFPSLVKYFVKEKEGMFKGDICRGSALYETGGIYLDVDVGARKNLWLDLRNETEFVTSRVHVQSHYPKHFFQAILGVAPQSPIIFKYLELFEDHYTGKERVEKGPLGVILLRRAWDRVYNETTGIPMTELYQEVLYDKKLFPHLHPAPTWGTRRACHFVVVASVNYQEHTELSWKGRDFHVPLYSRIAGSRLCPMKVTPVEHHDHGKTVKK